MRRSDDFVHACAFRAHRTPAHARDGVRQRVEDSGPPLPRQPRAAVLHAEPKPAHGLVKLLLGAVTGLFLGVIAGGVGAVFVTMKSVKKLLRAAVH